MESSLVFGPVPSRRLGRSLGVNNIPPKTCTYSCVYCQLGNTLTMTVERRAFYRPEEIVEAVSKHAGKVLQLGGRIDYVTFVPDGEPTLDINLGEEIAGIKALGFRVAVITNSSLIWLDDVRDALLQADWVSLKVDAVDEHVWRRVDRPHKSLKLGSILEGIQEFSRSFKGFLATETMLVSRVNDDTNSICE
ncbi:MAG: radical SAM protein, partial [Desulfurococcales archaeon]|nr:radical SAM protein [Desulfurococcales archaeon]